MADRKIIANRIQTPDGTILTSRHVHDCITYTDANGETYMVDGGHEYLRRIVNEVEATELSIFDDSPFKIIRENFEWATYGKDGKQPLRFVVLSEMSDEHIKQLLRQHYISTFIKGLLLKETQYRIDNKIEIME